jgi:putative Mg2+ transporter-C (MgtC) family protein
MPSFWSYFISGLALAARLILALLVGSAIGWNRRAVGRPAEVGTYAWVSLSAALLVTMIVEMLSPAPADSIGWMNQGIATGVGFLGAGMIVQSRPHVEEPSEGLTSAACIWVVAALGVVTACGMWQAALVGTLLTWLILQVGRWFE